MGNFECSFSVMLGIFSPPISSGIVWYSILQVKEPAIGGEAQGSASGRGDELAGAGTFNPGTGTGTVEQTFR